MSNARPFVPTVFLLMLVVLTAPACRKDRVQVLQPSGPIVEMPPAIIFRGEPAAKSQQAGTSGSRATSPAIASKKISPEQLETAEKQLQLHPNDPKAQSDAGSILAASGYVEEGVELLAKARAGAPDDPAIAYDYARALYEQGNTTESLKQADAALQLQPGFDEARVLEAGILIKQNNYDRAEQIIATVINALQITVRVIQGVIEIKRGHLDAALRVFQALVTTDPQNAIALYNLGVAQQSQQNLVEAERLYRAALQSDPNLPEAHNNLGTVLAQRGESEKAFEEFHAATVQMPSDPTMTANLSQISKGGRETEDVLAGMWVSDGGSGQATGTANRQRISLPVPVPAGSVIKISKVGKGEYRWEEQGLSTTIRLQPNGSYQGAAIIPPGLPSGISASGAVTFWVRGNLLFGDTQEKDSAPGISLQGARHWKAHRSAG